MYRFFSIITGKAIQIFDAQGLKQMFAVPDEHTVILFGLTTNNLNKLKVSYAGAYQGACCSERLLLLSLLCSAHSKMFSK